MFERFTDRARKAMRLANMEAQRLNHEYIGTEHVLLGLAKEGNGIAAHVLKFLDVDLDRIRAETEKRLTPGPDMILMGRLPLTPNVVRVVQGANDEAQALGHHYVGTEHVLLGLLRVPDGAACVVLKELGVTPEAVRWEILLLLGPPATQDTDPAIVMLDAAMAARRDTVALVAKLGDIRRLAATEHPGMTSADRLAKIVGLVDAALASLTDNGQAKDRQ